MCNKHITDSPASSLRVDYDDRVYLASYVRDSDVFKELMSRLHAQATYSNFKKKTVSSYM